MVPRDGGLIVLAKVEIKRFWGWHLDSLYFPCAPTCWALPGTWMVSQTSTDRQTQSRTCRFMSWAEQGSPIGVLSPLEVLTLTLIVREKWGGPTKLSHRGGAPYGVGQALAMA